MKSCKKSSRVSECLYVKVFYGIENYAEKD